MERTDKELLNFMKLNKGKLDSDFYEKRIAKHFPSLLDSKPKDLSWRNYYLTIMKYSDIHVKTTFKNKVVFITGGTSGIGLATAVAFASEGANVIVCGRRVSRWLEAQNYISNKLSVKERERMEYKYCDIRIESDVKNIIEYIFDKYGRLDVCFNNAGVQPGIVSNIDSGFITDMFLDSTVENGSIVYKIPPPQPRNLSMERKLEPTETSAASPFRESEIATSCIGTFYCLKWEIYYILKKQAKEIPVSIINTSSRNGVLPDSHRPLYAASKAFILSLTRSISNQVAIKSQKEGRAMIRINSVSPGPIDTILEYAAYGEIPKNKDDYNNYAKKASVGVPMKRTGIPEEIAPTILFLADPEKSSYITGSNICIDGGHTGSPLLCSCNI